MNCINRWEAVTEYTYRMKVPGGWLVMNEDARGSGLVFFPDPLWDWERWNTLGDKYE